MSDTKEEKQRKGADSIYFLYWLRVAAGAPGKGERRNATRGMILQEETKER